MKSSNSSNDKFFAPLPVFGQLISLVKSANIDPIIRKHKADKHYKKFTFYNHLFVMIAATITKVTSLRDLCSIFLSHANILHHLGISCLPKRSTLSYSNKNRSEQIFQAVFERIYQVYKSSILDSLKPLVFNGLGKSSVIVDSTTVGLFSSILRSTGRYSINGKKKGGIKLHMTIEDGVPIPSLCYITEAAVNDQKIFEKLTLKPNTIYIIHYGQGV